MLYILAARLGLTMDAVSGFATLVWPPTGIALSALLLFGYRLWPGVFLGALVANVLAGAPIVVGLGIGVGNTLEAVLGAYALRRIPGFRNSLDRLRDVLGLIVVTAALTTMVSATIGVSSLYLGGIVSPENVAETWRAWWLGDLISNLLVAPVILAWLARPRALLETRRLLEAAGLGASVVALSLLIFGGPAATVTNTFGQSYMLFPLLIWAAVRFGERGAVTAAFVISLIAVWGTAKGYGPFVRPALHQSLFALQTFMGVTAATFLVLGASISERRRAVHDLRGAITEQARLLAERDIAYQTAAQANRAKSEFLAVISHELRTPLNAISGYAELMSLETEGPLTQKRRDYLSRIQRNQQHLLSLIDDVLSFAKIEAGRLAFAMQAVPVREALEALESLIEPELRKKELTFVCRACDDSLSARADPDKLRQILLNLVGNAVKFTAPGGRISVGAEREGDAIRMWVSDTGIGMPADQLAQVFEPFFQVEGGPTRRYSGVGLGLSIARDLARAMGGDVRLESRAGEGTTVSLVLQSA